MINKAPRSQWRNLWHYYLAAMERLQTKSADTMKLFFSLGLVMILGGLSFGAELRIGIIGCDTSHVTAFTELLNNPNAKGHVPGAQVVAAFKGGSPDIPKSASRVDGFAKTLQEKYGVTIYDSIAALCTDVDAVLLESVDGRVHLEQAKPVIAARKPLFVDKPMAASLKDVVEIFRLAKEAKVPIWSSSSLRFAKDTQAVRGGSIGKVSYAETHSPCEVEPNHPELMWYGVHGVESLFTVMGTGCETVQRGITTNGLIEVVGTWTGGRKGVYRADKKYHGLARGESGETPVGANDGYAPLLGEILKFFRSGIAPVNETETIEMFAFMEAADESKRAGGTVVEISDVKARAKAP
jgi:hypothetical protein